MGRRTLLLIASILVAATGTGVVALYAKGADQRAGDQRQSVSLLVATGQIPAGTKAGDLVGLVQSRTFAQGLLPPEPITSLKQVEGLVTTIGIAKGQPLQRALFVSAAEQPAANPLGLDKSKIAVSIPMPDAGRVAGFVQDGSYVALYVLGGGGGQGGARGQGATQIQLLIGHPVRVLKVESLNAAGPTPGTTLVTLESTQKEAPRVIYASQNDTLYMALLPSGDTGLDTSIPPFSGDYGSD